MKILLSSRSWEKNLIETTLWKSTIICLEEWDEATATS